MPIYKKELPGLTYIAKENAANLNRQSNRAPSYTTEPEIVGIPLGQALEQADDGDDGDMSLAAAMTTPEAAKRRLADAINAGVFPGLQRAMPSGAQSEPSANSLSNYLRGPKQP
jgi:hypothetical protein